MNISEIKIGDMATISKAFLQEDIEQFAKISGDFNPLHLNEEYARNTIFKGKIVHGILVTGLISAVIASKLPGEGSIYLSQTLKFLNPVRIGDVVTAQVEVIDINREKKIITLRTICFINRDKKVIDGEAKIMIS